jgi:hypothetical protein
MRGASLRRAGTSPATCSSGARAGRKGGATGQTIASPGALAFVEEEHSRLALVLVVLFDTDLSVYRDCRKDAEQRRLLIRTDGTLARRSGGFERVAHPTLLAGKGGTGAARRSPIGSVKWRKPLAPAVAIREVVAGGP